MINIFSTIKKWFIWFFLGSVVLAGGVDMVIVTESEKLDSINTFQTQELSKGHYKHIPRTYVQGNDYQVDEYKLPNGEVGYTVTRWKTESEKGIKKVIDYGSLNRGTDWIIIKNNVATTT